MVEVETRPSLAWDVRPAAPADLPRALAAVADGARAVLLHAPGTVVSAYADGYIRAVLAMAADPRIAAASLAVPRVRPGSTVPFVPIEDGGDTLYCREALTAALLVTPAQAARAAAAWPPAAATDALGAYLARSGRYFLCPRTPLAHDRTGHCLLLAGDRRWRIAALDDGLAVYDERLELAPAAAARFAPSLAGRDVAIDLWGDAPLEGSADALLLSSRPCAAPLVGYPLEMVPAEANLAAPVAGGFFSLGRRGDFAAMTAARRDALFRHATRYNAMDDYVGQFVRPLRRLLPRRP